MARDSNPVMQGIYPLALHNQAKRKKLRTPVFEDIQSTEFSR